MKTEESGPVNIKNRDEHIQSNHLFVEVIKND